MMKTLLILVLALPLAAQTTTVCDPDCTAATLDPGVVWDRPTRTIKPRVPTQPPPVSTIHTPRTAAELQTAINKAVGGDQIHLAAGLTYSGNFTLPGKPAPVTIRPADLSWSTAGKRVKPSDAAKMGQIRSINSMPAVMVAGGNWALIGLDVGGVASTNHTINVIQIGDEYAPSLAALPQNVTIDRCYIHGDLTHGTRRGVYVMGRQVTIRDSYISDAFAPGNEAQAVGIFESQGVTVENNFLEGAGENLFIASIAPVMRGVFPSDIVIRRNHMFKRLAWQARPGPVVKNSMECKSCQNVLIEGNVFENCWASAQTGYSVLFTVRDENGDKQAEISGVTFRNNKLVNVANGWNALGKDDYAGNIGRMFGVVIENNLIEGAVGRAFQFLNGIEDLAARRNTVLGSAASIWSSDGMMSDKVSFTGNAIGYGQYGIHHTGTGDGTRSIVAFWRTWDVTGNVFFPAPCCGQPYPPGNTFVANAAAIPAGVGVDMAALNAAIAGVVQP